MSHNNTYDDDKSSGGDYYLVPNNDKDDDDVLLVENDNYVYVVRSNDEKERNPEKVLTITDDDRRKDTSELKVIKSKEMMGRSLGLEKIDRAGSSIVTNVRVLATFVVIGMWIVWSIQRGGSYNNHHNNIDPTKILSQQHDVILSETLNTNSMESFPVVDNNDYHNKILTDDDKFKQTDDDFMIPVTTKIINSIKERRGSRPSSRSRHSSTTQRRNSRGGKLNTQKEYSDDDDDLVVIRSTTKREYPTKEEHVIEKLSVEDMSSIKSLQATVRGRAHSGQQQRRNSGRRGSYIDSRSMTTATSERTMPSISSASMIASRNRRDLRGEVRIVHESLVLDTNYITYVSYDNYGTFMDTKTQPAGSERKIILVFYKPTYRFDLEYAPILNEIGRNNDVAIGIINCCKHKRICKENKIEDYPTIRTYIQRLPKLDSATQKIQYKRYFYETVTDITTLKAIIVATTPIKKEVKQHEYPNFDSTDGVVTKEQRRQLAHNIHMIEPTKREYPSMVIVDGKYSSSNSVISASRGSSLPKHRLGRQRVLTQKVLDTNRIQLLSYKTFYDFFIGQTQGTKNQILMVFYKPNNDFNVDVAPVLNQLAELGEHIGVVHCQKYPRMCEDHSITDYPTIRWYSHDKYAIERAAKKHHNWNEDDSAATKKHDEKTLWYEPTTIDTLKIYIQEKSILLLSTTTTEKIDLQQRDLHSSDNE